MGGMQGNGSQTMSNSFVGTMQRPNAINNTVPNVLRGRGSSDNTQLGGRSQQPVFYQMNNNFMIVNIVNGNGNNSTTTGVVNGQTTNQQ